MRDRAHHGISGINHGRLIRNYVFNPRVAALNNSYIDANAT
ncbi:MAG: hypothetical protein OSB02_03625 [Rhodospirillaceae bacterium]|nr:hypothetical protein [Rhodospirillaceae bacterium]